MVMQKKLWVKPSSQVKLNTMRITCDDQTLTNCSQFTVPLNENNAPLLTVSIIKLHKLHQL